MPKGHRTLRDPRSFVALASGIKMVHRLPESCQLGRFCLSLRSQGSRGVLGDALEVVQQEPAVLSIILILGCGVRL